MVILNVSRETFKTMITDIKICTFLTHVCYTKNMMKFCECFTGSIINNMAQHEVIQQYVEHLIKRNKYINLVQHDTLNDVYGRHIADCMQINKFLTKEDYIIDVGSGAGLPGVVLSILGYKNVILCEKSYKKCIFLQEIKSRLKLDYAIFNGDIFGYQVPEQKLTSAVLVSRAFGSLKKLLSVMDCLHVSRGTFHKGKTYNNEIEEARLAYQFECKIAPSEIVSDSVILNVSGVRRK